MSSIRWKRREFLVEKMKEGTNIALITDAGTPGNLGSGEELVKQCYEAGIELVFSFWTGGMHYGAHDLRNGDETVLHSRCSYLPIKRKSRILEELKSETRTIILNEAPHRLVRTLEESRR